MTTITKLPNTLKSFEALKIMLDLEIRTDPESLLGHSILLAISQKKKYSEVIQFVKDCARDNMELVACVIGVELTHRILNFDLC